MTYLFIKHWRSQRLEKFTLLTELLGLPSGSGVKKKKKICLPCWTHGQETNVWFQAGRSPGGGNGNPLQYPCLENPNPWGCERVGHDWVIKQLNYSHPVVWWQILCYHLCFEFDILHPENMPNLSLKRHCFRIIPCCWVFKFLPFTCSRNTLSCKQGEVTGSKHNVQCRRPRFNPWVGKIPCLRKALESLCSPFLVFLNYRQSLGSGDVTSYCSNLYSFKWMPSVK